jgi:enediyne biosynthesis protein E4
MWNKYLSTVLFFICIMSCNKKSSKPLFEMQSSTKTNIHFTNEISDTAKLNILDYLYYYNGGGVATGDVNNDGLVDVFFTSNTKGNTLYVNKGNFVFEDVTKKAGVASNADWTTGVVMADVNADGWLDVYVSTVTNHTPQNGQNAGRTLFLNGANQLYINNKNGTFKEQANEYGLQLKGYNTQAVFFDYDNDGDNDMFQLQHSIHQTDTYGDTALRKKYSDVSGCKLLQNNNNKYSDVTKSTGLYSSALGYGLGVAVADYNHDGWQDIYVGNDFHESDYYYINNGNKTFTEKNKEAFMHQSNFSMGNDAADLNNDGWTDIVTLDMLPDDEKVLKSSANDEALDTYEAQRQNGYSYQYSRNALQLNTNKGKNFSEIALYSGIAATDWSWSVLANDYNYDGNKDLIITNGIKKRMNDLDYVKFLSSTNIKANAEGTRIYDKDILDKQPTGQWHNYAFSGNANLKFDDKSTQWGFENESLSNGAAYADFDNDGDIDFVTNNINSEASVYKNTLLEDKNIKWSNIVLKNQNQSAIGAKCFVYAKNNFQFQELQTVRGFLSSVEPKLFFGFSDTTIIKIDSIVVVWNNKEMQVLYNIATNKVTNIIKQNTIAIKDYNALIAMLVPQQAEANIKNVTAETNIFWKHKENNSFIDFNRQWLIPHQYSTKGPAVAIADINGDGLDDMFLGGAKTQPSIIYVQTANGQFLIKPNIIIANDSLCEDVDAVFFDADNDNDKDLYVVSGGNEFYEKSVPILDRLYINDGKGNFIKSTGLPDIYANKSCVTVADIDNDNDIDIFVGGSCNAAKYGTTEESHILINNGNANFKEETIKWNTAISNIGLVTDAVFADFNNDKKIDLAICGEWMAPSIFINTNNKFVQQKKSFLRGWYQHINATDFDNDGNLDIVLGNFGTNTKLNASSHYPMTMQITDLDKNKTFDQILSVNKEERYYPFATKENLEKQLPYLKKEYLSYTKMAGKTTSQIFGKKLNDANELYVDTMGSFWLKNIGQANFSVQALPSTMQWSPIYSSYYINNSLFFGGNFYGTIPYEGRYDATAFGNTIFTNNKWSTNYISDNITGEVRNILPITIKQQKHIVVVRNNNTPIILQLNSN